MARLLPEGSLETVHQERDPVRPGEGLFTTGSMPRAVADRLLSTLRRYGALSRRYKARVRAVATSAVREAKNRDEIVQRARQGSGAEPGGHLRPGGGAPDLSGRAAGDARSHPVAVHRHRRRFDRGGQRRGRAAHQPVERVAGGGAPGRAVRRLGGGQRQEAEAAARLRRRGHPGGHPGQDEGLPAHRPGQLGDGAVGGRLRRRRGHRPRHRPPADPRGGRAGRDGGGRAAPALRPAPGGHHRRRAR